jgi:short-subunit dehydrogenase
MGRNALITGASSGIGRALAERLARDGFHVVLCARRADALREVMEAISRAGGSASIEPMDVADTERTVQRIREIDRSLSGGLDLVIANAGVGERKGHVSYAWEAIADACHVNFTGAAATVTAALPAMVSRGRGHIVGISSLASFGPLPKSAAYCAAKAGLSMLLECLRLDVESSGVKVTTVHVGFVKTPMTERATHPMPQLMEVSDAADHIVDALASGPASIDFPQPLAAVTWAAGRLPRGVRDLLQRGLARVR